MVTATAMLTIAASTSAAFAARFTTGHPQAQNVTFATGS